MDWFGPQNFKEWLARCISLRSFLILFGLLMASIAELQFFWIENNIGAYLVTTNTKRPQTGPIWEAGLKSLTAKQTLDALVNTQATSQYDIQSAQTFREVAARLAPNSEVMMAPEHFRRLYLNLPLNRAEAIIPPLELLNYYSMTEWTRVMYKKDAKALEIFFLNEDNQVLKKVRWSSDPPPLAEEALVEEGSLDAIAGFQGRILGAKSFFDVWETISPEIRARLFPDPQCLLTVPGRLTRIGFGRDQIRGVVDVGIELENGAETQVVWQKMNAWGLAAFEPYFITQTISDPSPEKGERFESRGVSE